VNGIVCDERTFKVNSIVNFMQVIKGLQDSPLQRNCYIVEFGKNNIELNVSETLNISTSMILHGMGAIVTCSYPPNQFDHSAIIRVNNVQYFGISGITFLGCPSSLSFENVTSISINASHFRYELISWIRYNDYNVCIYFFTSVFIYINF